MKKRFLKALVAITLTVSLLLTACGAGQGKNMETKPGTSPDQEGTPDNQTQEEPMSHEDLVKAAEAEGKLTVYATTSRVSKAAEKFMSLYNIEVETANLKDGELVEKVSLEVTSGVDGADLVLCQDGARVYGELINPGYLVNYVPESLKEVIPAQDQNPLVFEFVNRVFIYNNEKSDEQPFKNIWELTEPEWKDRVQIKNPNNEGVQFNFLTMLTREDYADQIAQAYKDYYGKDIELTTPNAGYEWMKAFFENVVFGTSDTNMAENIGTKGQAEQLMGLFVLSKLRYSETKDLALKPSTEVTPFVGYYYPIYVQLTANAKNVNAAKLFTEFLLTEEGFEPWLSDIGSYSANPQVPSNEDDEDMTFWGPRLVREDPVYSYENRAEVEEFVNNIIN